MPRSSQCIDVAGAVHYMTVGEEGRPTSFNGYNRQRGRMPSPEKLLFVIIILPFLLNLIINKRILYHIISDCKKYGKILKYTFFAIMVKIIVSGGELGMLLVPPSLRSIVEAVKVCFFSYGHIYCPGISNLLLLKRAEC